ncbi:MAG: PD-(D/E)XK nuclease family protein [Solirubrobacteraceae bacterium]|jgi:ATP-dependent helicase/DNAse subunit B
MPLTLVVGPANSAKAHVVLERYRAALPRAPILVVPRSADAEHYRRELAQGGTVLGVRVEPFSALMREIAVRAGLRERPLGEHARAALLRATVAQVRLDALAPAARSPAFVPALARFVAQLESQRVEPPRLTRALRLWSGAGRRRPFAQELATLYTAYRRRLERLGRLDAELYARATLDALTLAPERWHATPVFCYGFDDLDVRQLDTIETLAHRVGAQVTVSLPGEPGRLALAGRATTLETLRPGADELIELGPQSEFYEDPALHHLERALFEDGARAAAGAAVRLLEGADERAESELVAAEVAELIAAGFVPGEIAILTRGAPEPLADALAARAIPHAEDRRDRLDATVIGRTLLARLRVAAGEGTVEDLIACLAVEPVVGPKDAFEARLRRRGISDLRAARELWEREHGPLLLPDTLDGVERDLEGLLAVGAERSAPLIDPWEGAAAAAVRRVLSELRELEPATLGGTAGIERTLAAVTVELRANDPAAVSIADPLTLRARRVRALFICATQEGVFPALVREEPLLGSAERAELGLTLGAAGDQLAAERYLFYALCSRPTSRLRVSWHAASDAGEATPASLFVEELRDCFDASLECRHSSVPASTIAARRGAAIAPLARPERLAALRGRVAHSASGLESWASCPVAWLVEHGFRARELAPDSIFLARGLEAHRVLAAVFDGLEGRLDERTLPRALELLEAELAQRSARLSPLPAVERAERRRLGAELRRYLRFAASLAGEHEPAVTELSFGVEGAKHDAVELADGLSLVGRIDRVDLAVGGSAIVYDYKTGGGVDGWASWVGERKLQPALYMLAVERLLGVEAAGGLYQPLRTADLQPRGAIREDVREAQDLRPTDRLAASSLRTLLDERLRTATELAAEIERGALESRPASCSRHGCRYPAICRAEAS